MTDTTQGDQLPDVGALFPEKPPPDVDSLFPASVENERYRRQQLGTSPVQDFLMSDDGPVGTTFHSAGRVLKAFGQGVNDAGPATALSKETNDYLKKWSGYDKWNDTAQKIARAANNVLLQPAAYDLSLMWHGLSGALTGGQAAVAQLGKEVGQEKLGREVAAIPEAFPTFEFRGGMPSPADVARARALSVIGPEGEAGWKGTAVPTEEAAKPPGVTSTAAEAPAEGTPLPEILVEPEGATPVQPDIHAAVRQAEPALFEEYDALMHRRDILRRFIDEREDTDRGGPGMERVASNLKETEARLRDLAPKVADAYRSAEAPATAEPPVAPGMVRMYHGGDPEGFDHPLWFSSNRRYAEDWRAGNSLWYVDIPEDHPLIQPEYPEQSVKHGFTFNRELPTEIASQRKLLKAGSEATAAPAVPLAAPKPFVKPVPIRPIEGSPNPSLPRTEAARTGDPLIDAILHLPIMRVIINNPVVDDSHSIPNSLGGSEPLNNPTLYRDRDFPKSMTVDGVTFDTADPSAVHENVEEYAVDVLTKAGMDHATALKVAYWNFGEVAEDAWYRSHGMDPKKVEAEYTDILNKIAARKADDVPPDLFKGTYPDGDPAKAGPGPIGKPTAAETARAREIIGKHLETEHGRPAVPATTSAAGPGEVREAAPVGAPAAGEAVPGGETASGEPRAASAPGAAVTPPAPAFSIAKDLTGKLTDIGIPHDEAAASAIVQQAYWETEAAQFQGRKGTAEDIYRRETPAIVQGTVTPRAPRKVDEEKLSLLQFLAHRGGLKRTGDLEATLDRNPFVPGFGRLFRNDGMTEDQALVAAVEAGYIDTEEGIRGRGNIRDFHAAINDEARGRKRYRQGYEPAAGEHPMGPEAPAEGGTQAQPESASALMTPEDEKALLFQQNAAPPFYSAVERAVTSAKQEKASPDQWLGMLKNMPGVKPEEMEWLGLSDWLKEQKGSVTKAQIADYVRANQIEVKEVEHGRPVDADTLKQLETERSNLRPQLDDARRQISTASDRNAAIAEVARLNDRYDEIGRQIRDAFRAAPTTKFSSYQLPGGENYRELLLTLPEASPAGWTVQRERPYGDERVTATVRDRDGNSIQQWQFNESRERHEDADLIAQARKSLARSDQFRSSHFDEPNILAHVRFNDRVIDGKKTLLVEEVQSDWHQKGKKEGYAGAQEAPVKRALTAEEARRVGLKEGDERYVVERNGQIIGVGETADEAKMYAGTASKLVPDAPFKTTWPELAMKRMIRYAAENGYDRVAWTTGETQAARYDLSKQVSRVQYNPESGKLWGYDHHNNAVIDHRVEKEKLADFVGKEVAEKLLKSEPDKGWHTVSGVDLKVGGEGMRGFYDQILPATVNKLTKKFGGKVGRAEVGAPPDEEAFRAAQRSGDSEEIANASADRRVPVHTLDISDKLRDAAVEQGFPLFQGTRVKRGSYRISDDPAIRDAITYFKDANASTLIHEPAHGWLNRMMSNAADPLAPDQLKADAKTTLDWLGVDKAEDLNERTPSGNLTARARKANEKFARGFEAFMLEGWAPSEALARVFAQFQRWLVKIYGGLAGLEREAGFKIGLDDRMRAVYDRMLTAQPRERPVIAPERELPKSLGDIHEADVEAAPPEHPAERRAANVIQSERDSHAGENLLEGEHADRLGDVEPGTGSRAPGSPKPDRDGNAAEPDSQEGGAAQGAGTVGAGGSEAAGAGAPAFSGTSKDAIKSEPPATANAPFTGPKSALVDKAGNIRLDKLDTPEDVTQVIRDTAAVNDDFTRERRGVLSDPETLELADALGMDPAWLDRKRIGDAFNVEEIRAARRLLVRSATEVRDAMVAAKDGATEAVVKMAQAIAKHEMIQAKVAQATAEAGRALRAFREVIPGGENVGMLDTWLKQNTGRTFYQLQQMARYGANLRNPAQVGRFVFDTANGKIKQAIIYYYVNALISGPITHLRYAAGNALTALWTPLVKIPMAVASGTARQALGFERDAERVYMGEAGAQLYGIMKGSREGLRAALEGWRTGNTPHLPGEAAPDMFEAQPVMPPIPGKIGFALGIPGKSVGAIHGFFSALRYEQEIHGLAYRTAMQEGLSGDAFTNRVADLTDRPTQDMMEKAAPQARKDLYMAPADYQSFEAKLSRIANHNIASKIILPFVKIGTQIVRTAMIESSPLGVFDQKVRDNLSGKNGNAAREMQAGGILAGTALMGTMVAMVTEGLATGDGPSDPGKRAVWLLNHHPNSIQVGNLTVSYERLGALGMLMRTAANATETAHGWGDDEGHVIVSDFLYGMERAILGESFLTGVKDMIDAVYHHEEYGARYVAQMVTNWIPFSVGLGQVARLSAIDPYKREVHGNSLIEDIWKEAQAKVPWLSRDLMPRRDMFGEPIPQSGPVQNYENDRVVQRMNDLHIKAGRLPRKLRGIDLTDQQYDDYARISGKHAKMLLNAIVQPGFERLPKGIQLEMIEKSIREGREVGANAVIMKAMGSGNDIMMKSVQNKESIVTDRPKVH